MECQLLHRVPSLLASETYVVIGINSVLQEYMYSVLFYPIVTFCHLILFHEHIKVQLISTRKKIASDIENTSCVFLN